MRRSPPPWRASRRRLARAGREDHHLTRAARPGGGPMAVQPLRERDRLELWQGELRRDAGRRLLNLAGQPVGADQVAEGRLQAAAQLADRPRLTEQLIAQRHALAARALRLLARHQARNVEQLGGPLVGGVGALDVAKLALPAQIADQPQIGERGLLRALGAVVLDVTIAGGEQRRERPAIADAHAALVTDLNEALRLSLQLGGVPVARVVRSGGGRAGGTARDD